jgi:heptosyltransferase-2
VKGPSVDKIERIVVRGVNWVGDAVMTVPALRELRRLFPAAHITLSTRSWAEGLFRDSEFLDEILTSEGAPGHLKTLTRQRRQWKDRKFDLAVLLPNAFQPALVAALSRVPIRVGYVTEGRGFLLTQPIPLPGWRDQRHEVFFYLNIVSELESRLLGRSSVQEREPEFSLNVSNERKADARRLLANFGVLADRALVILCPGSINSRAKRWPAERFAALGDRLIQDTGVNVALIGSAEEIDVAREVEQIMRHHPTMLAGLTDLAQVTAILSISDLLITNDTGPAHIGAALGRPTLVIFGPTNPATTRPFSSSAEIVRHAPDCAPCMLRDCPIDHRCMTAITAAEVFERSTALLARNHVEVGA